MEPKEIRPSDPNNIWEWFEVPEIPHTDDIHEDPRIKPEYDIKYKQFVATEDIYLQVIHEFFPELFCITEVLSTQAYFSKYSFLEQAIL